MLHKSIWLSNCITLIWTHAAAAEAVKPFKFFRNFLLSILHFFCVSSNSYSVHRSLLIIMWHVFYVRSRCFCLFFCFRLLQMDFKMLNSQSANITFHLKQSHSFVRLYSQVGVSVCVCLTMCLPFLSLFLFLLKFLFAEQWVCVRECFLLLCIEYYWAHTTVTQYMYLK